MKTISIGIICYNEGNNIEPMYEAVTEQMRKFPSYDYEIVFEDNDSKDNSPQILRNIAERDKHVKVILNQANFGPDRSLTNCMMNLAGDAVILIPCDFQEPPEMIPDFIRGWEDGYDVVWGQKKQSEEIKIKYFLRSVYYKIIKLFAEYSQLEHVTGFGLMDKKVLDVVLISKRQDSSIQIRNIIPEYGYKLKLIPYTQRKRLYGTSNYNVFSYLSFAVASFCNTSTKPLRIMTVLGLVSSFFTLICAVVYFVYKIIFWNSFIVGIAPLVIGLFFCSSIQLFCMGVLGEYIGVLLRKVTDKPIVVEKEKINFDK